MMSFYRMGAEGWFTPFLLIIIIWTLFWKAYAVWIAVKNGHKKWFIVLLILNTLGILEIIYIFYVAKKKWSDIRNTLKRLMK